MSTTAAKQTARSEPLTAAELKAALLAPEQAVGFTITESDSRQGSPSKSSRVAGEEVSPEPCRPVREAPSQNVPGRGESAAAWSTMYRGKGAFSPRSSLLTSYPENGARTRMSQLRQAVETCGRFTFSNAYGDASVTTETLTVPDLGDEAVRYRTLARLGNGGFHYSLVTAVRVGGVIATMQTSDVTGPLPPDELAKFKPDPNPDERVIAALVENVVEAES
ncbi:hypothetical protein ACN6LK_003615 [Streptomyces griseus]|uniref:hypothetical protein n=1 Tax=Streptomyces griseus TaxID=1911 RepID=UPI00403C78EE